ncbi:Dolichyl-diphosphooligosaccharide--protein glycosyltransferase subunit 4 [Dichotomopilus funicola]|uniref:Dolichyl-diphosphooligosaccharide--protein glycosyltransferase subunit 4 n=1 Tax=Dichotomopilus funicola TaxID=1934379 RepID=A0AAN6ZKU9_9PEZI|nr:Dolichyl-diphosphooligosaccharide--protein glycosyltransferase subunit 4 [Dichotomopilus funicola]
MISDNELYRLAIVLGSAAAALIILHAFFDVNSGEKESQELKGKTTTQATPAVAKAK